MPKEKVACSNKQHFVAGLKKTLEALKKGQVTSLIIVEGIKVYLMTRVLSRINQKNIPVSFFKSEHTLGKHVGINVNATTVALIKWELVSVLLTEFYLT